MISNGIVSGGPEIQIPSNLSFGQHVIEKLKQIYDKGDKVAMINGQTGEQISYKELLQRIVNISTGLKNIGLSKGDVVALCSENCNEYLTTTVAASCAGATVTSFNVNYTKDEMLHTISISKPNLIFCSEAALRNWLTIFKDMPYIQHIVQLNGTPVSNDVAMLSSLEAAGDINTFTCVEVDNLNDTAFIQYSSGTTGLPKGVALTHWGVQYASSIWNYSSTNNSRLLTVTRWYHVYGLLTTIQYISTSNLIIYLSDLNPETYLNAIEKYKITELLTVPTIMVIMAKSALVEKYDLSSVKLVWSAAAPLGEQTKQQTLKNLHNCKGIFQAYGMTETSLAVVKEPEIISGKSGSCGKPLPGIDAKVVDINTGEKLGSNQDGEVCLRGPTLMKGYVDNEEATRDIFDSEGFIKTGDIGYYDSEGWFYIVDRIKEIIKYKGQQVAPAVVEAVILEHPGVADCGVVGTPDELAGELPTAFVVAKAGTGLTEKQLLDFTSAKLSPASRLRGGVIFISEIPKNSSGKILRRELRKMIHNYVKLYSED